MNGTMEKPQCIYCLRSDVTFKEREHVVPESFGTFSSDTFTLHSKVCDECNQYYGDNLDILLARDTREGLKRSELLKKRVKSPKGIPRLKLTLPDDHPDENVRGVIINLPKYKNEGVLEPISQVHFKSKKTQKYEVFSLSELKKAKDFDKDRYIYKDIKIIAPNEEQAQEVQDQLKRMGIDYIKKQEIYTPERPEYLQITGDIDSLILRAISKIAFNYIAHVYPSINLLEENFNRAREYIRYGKGTLPIKLENHFLAQEDDYIQAQTDGILIGTEYRRNNILCVKIRIFDYQTYVVPLAVMRQKVKGIGYLFKPGLAPVQMDIINLETLPFSIVTLSYDPLRGGFFWRERRGKG
jgi:hypothetical protein